MAILNTEESRVGQVPHPRLFIERKRRTGAALITTLFATFVLSLFVGATVLFVTSTHSLAWSRNNSEAALLLAEGGVNREMQYIAKRMQARLLPFAHDYRTVAGEPYPGEPGTIDGMPGKVWTYATQPGTTKAWEGKGPAEITCTAVVGGEGYSGNGLSWGPPVQKKLVVQCRPQSIFGAFAVFGLDSANNNNQPSIGITGGSTVRVTGNVGTNGIVQGGAGFVDYTRAYNYNSEYSFPSGSSQFDSGTTYVRTPPLIIPTVTEVLASIVPTTQNPWDWMSKNNDNDKIRQFSNSSSTLSNSGTQSAGFKRTQSILTNSNFNIGTDGTLLTKMSIGALATSGSWTGINSQGSTSKRVLIFPPGDYYFTGMDLGWDASTVILVDNGGLTTPQGSNPDGKQVRFWFNNGGQADKVQIPIKLTAPDDTSTFRIYYGKDGSVFSFIRDSGFPDATYMISGCVYAVTSRIDPLTLQPVDSTKKGTQINFYSNTDTIDTVILYGSLIADRVSFKGNCSVIYPSAGIDNDDDPAIGVGYTGDCDREPCYSG